MPSHNTSRTIRRRAPRQRRSRRGFTLLEIMVVIMIIALLAALVTPRVWRHLGTGRTKVAEARAAQLATEMRLYLAEHGMSRVPGNFDLQVLVDTGRIREKDLYDPWNNPFVLVAPGEMNPDFDIVSYGADGQPGGEGEDADIVH